MARPLTRNDDERAVLARLAAGVSYEVMPFPSTVGTVRAHVPTEVPLTVTATGGKGLEPTIATSIALRQAGYTVAPHLAARLITGPEELDQILTRLEAGGVDRLFVIAGDAGQPAGVFTEALDVLRALHDRMHLFEDLGIGGYPEGHAGLSDEQVRQAMRDKAPYAHRILTQICFDADAFLRWGAQLRTDGVELPVYAGMPGPVSRQKLMRISASLGLGQSANFLKKQRTMLWRFFSPAGYSPDGLVRGLVRGLPESRAHIAGFHLFTFNEIAATEAWRRRLLAEAGLG
ncbi:MULTISPECIES: methylenetetrahydrofolate reductase [Actinomycetes]|uniref:Methylenetetrahydrofolate reductase n=2 Tax=Actinomycetes TaxID=1760 RepID=A0ABP6LXE7_9MICC